MCTSTHFCSKPSTSTHLLHRVLSSAPLLNWDPHPVFWTNLMYAAIYLFHSFLFSHFSFRKPISVWMIWQSQARGAKWWIFRPPTKLRHLKLCYRYVYLHYLVPIIFPELCRMSRYSMHTQRGWREASHWINVPIVGKNL